LDYGNAAYNRTVATEVFINIEITFDILMWRIGHESEPKWQDGIEISRPRLFNREEVVKRIF